MASTNEKYMISSFNIDVESMLRLSIIQCKFFYDEDDVDIIKMNICSRDTNS